MTPAEYRQRGIPLREAWRRLAGAISEPANPARRRTDSLPAGWEGVASQSGWDEARKQALQGALDGVAEIADAILASGALNYQRARYVADLILKGRAVATGFPEGATEPVVIPAYLFETDQFIKWAKDQVVGNNLQYFSVRITKIGGKERTPANPKVAPMKKGKAGRRGYPELSGLIAELNGDPSFVASSQKQQGTILLNEVRRRYPDRFPATKDISRATLYRYLGKPRRKS